MTPADLAFKTILEINDNTPGLWIITFTDGSSVSLQTVFADWAGCRVFELEEV